MASSDSGEKTEKATPKRKRDERKKGNVFSSQDIVAAFSILITFFTLKICFELMSKNITGCITFWLERCGQYQQLTKETINQILLNSIKTILIIAGPLLFIAMITPVIFTGIQTKFIISKEALKPKFSRLNPISGMKMLISLRAVVELVKNLLKIAIIGSIIYSQLKKRLAELVQLIDVDIKAGIVYLCSSVFSIVITISVIFILIGVVDIFYQWWEYERNLKMTKHEVKEEYKQMEGDPQIKGAIKQKQRQMSQARMMQDVKTADVVVRNPTHFAVAIRYDSDKDRAPVIVAKGMDYVALKIIEIASENDIIMQENKPLARALYHEVDVGREIPEEFYRPVAEILAFVYDIKHKKISQ